MLRFLKRLFAAFVAFSICTVIISAASMAHPALEREIWGYRNFNYGANNIRLLDFNESCRNGATYDYLFLGSSTTYRSVNPRMLEPHGIGAFNLGSSSQSLRNSYRLLQWAFNHPCSFNEVQLGLDENALTSDGYESTIEFIMNNNQAIDLDFGRMTLDYGDPYTVLTWFFYGLRRQLRPAILTPPGADTYIDGGFVFANDEPALEFDCAPKNLEISQESLSLISRIQRLCNQNQTEFRLLIPPSPCDITWSLQSGLEDRTLDGNEWPDAKVDSMYYDKVHLRGPAANSYSNWLGAKFKRLAGKK